MANVSPYIIEAEASTFEAEVLGRSASVPVVVDFWAAWCGPCRLLGPILEKLAEEYDGRFLLVKADTERMPEIAASFGVRSIPAVFGVRDGRVVDGFVGVLAESAIRAFLDRLVPGEAEQAVMAARALEASDPGAAEWKYREALALSADQPAAKVGLGRLALARGSVEEAREVVAELEQRGYLEPEAEALKAELTLRAGASQAGDVASAREAVAAKPEDLATRLELAEALIGAREFPEALDLLLDLVERDRRGTGETARTMMLAVFQVLPDDSPLTNEYRRKLSFVL